MTQTAKIKYIKPEREVNGRFGSYKSQGVLLEWHDENDQRQSAYGTFFANHLDAFQLLNAKAGDMLTVDLVFSISERNGFVSNFIELRNPTFVFENENQ